METSTMFQPSITYGSSQEDFRANHLVLPGSEQARQMTVGSGQKWLELLTASDHIGSWLRMCLESLAWNSTRCYLTWKVSITPRRRLLFRLSASTLHTEESEFGLLAMPTTAGIQPPPDAKMWPTPDANSGKRFGQNPKKINPKRQFTINDAARLWPTPTTQDASNNGVPSQYNRNSLPLNAEVGGSLNPDWVEWLMGFPTGWTALED